MKKLPAILLLSILLFNWVGYRLFTTIVETRSSAELVAAFDSQNTENMEMISVKVPSSLPYYTGTGEFERAVGEIEIDHIQYSYVQRKVTHDSIEYICVVNTAGTAVKKASDHYFKLVNDVQSDSTKKDSSAKVKLLKSDSCQPDNIVIGVCQTGFYTARFEAQCSKYYSLSVAPPDLPPNSSI